MFFETWETACSVACGANSREFIEKKYAAARAVLAGHAAFERDSVLFQKAEFHWPFVASLMRCAALLRGHMTVLDFGGGFASLYLQHRSLLEGLSLRWNIVELGEIVELGNKLQISNVAFYGELAELPERPRPDLAIVSGVLHYMQDPYGVLDRIANLGVRWIIIDRIPLSRAGERIALQTVSPEIAAGTYPYWILARNRLIEELSNDFRVVLEFGGFDPPETPDEEYTGLLFERIEGSLEHLREEINGDDRS